MPSVKVLKTKFDDLSFTSDNIVLYAHLLTLDMSDFKPLMEEILLGRIDIEDTRQLFQNEIETEWSGKYFTPTLSDPRISNDIIETMKSNLSSRLAGEGDNIIKENLLFPSQADIKDKIAQQFFEEHGIRLSPEDVERILPIVETQLFAELSIVNTNGVRNKADQLIISDQLSFKPIAEL